MGSVWFGAAIYCSDSSVQEDIAITETRRCSPPRPSQPAVAWSLVVEKELSREGSVRRGSLEPLGLVQRVVRLAADPQLVQQDRQLSSHRYHRSSLGSFATAFG